MPKPTEHDRNHSDEYDSDMVAVLELIWGTGFMAPGGPALVHHMVQDLNVKDKLILDIGCGLGGGDLVLARELGARVIGIDLEAPLIEQAKMRIEAAGLSDKIEARCVQSGPLAFPDNEFDVVYSVGAFTQTEDKLAIFGEAFRVLKPAGVITSYDWMKTDRPISDAMVRWFELEGLTYALATLEEHQRLLEEAGFESVEVADDGGAYARECEQEFAQLRGPLRSKLVDAIGPENTDHYIEDWQATLGLLQAGELVPGFMRGIKPR